ncbi:MAG: zinc-dependent metalloprotease [Micropruina sp.]|uniref:zinc-dependent metalloprotease n=1 Tax=Micropruina sp. TaxID=2737536 RepID=UPI0039E6F53C
MAESAAPDVPDVDWRVASATGRLLVPSGPDLTRGEAAAVVADLRACADRATEAVAAASGLDAPAAADVLIVDRAGWVRGAVSMTEAMFRAAGQQPPATMLRRIGGRFAASQVGTGLAFVATRILGQFDPYSSTPRLLLVAPNVVAAERAMAVEPHGFRQWVCLHEQTHRFQFGAAPWLSGRLLELLRQVFADEPDALDRVTAVMSLLEGHADVVMDAAGQQLVPQVARLREVFEARRDAGGLIQLISRLFGLRAKREQYLSGARFCRAVIAEAGVDGLNLAFRAPELMPTSDELLAPTDWLRRVPERIG